MDCLLSLKFAMSLCFVRKYVGTVRMYLGLLEPCWNCHRLKQIHLSDTVCQFLSHCVS
jgi:hypothetical protein